MNKVIIILALLCTFISNAQETKKTVLTKRTTTPPKINGKLDDIAWKDADIAKDFVQFRPENGTKEPETHKTEVKIVYDDEAIYFGAYLYDNNPSGIPVEFTTRDNVGQNDFFLVILNPNNDGQNATEFAVTSSGVQFDAKVTKGNEDGDWSAVWVSDISMQKDGWIVEMKIPYSALRFSNKKIQTWGINFHRKMLRRNEQYTWNFIDRTKGIWTQYDGILEGIQNINPPTRLSFYPYASATVDSYDGESNSDYSIGLDVKYGISESFTLDATLIPDFGQTAFDNVTLNLGPFEQQYSEQRQFFTEGTELFSKGGLFYSRRIGNTPVEKHKIYKDLEDNETVVKNPDDVKMINAIKVSGRTKKGLGIGVFNAVTEKTEATIKKTITNPDNTTSEEYYKKVTEPLANYSVLVLDQQFNKHSSVTLINTNVLREGRFRDANVTGLLYNLKDRKTNSYFIDGSVKTSTINENGEKTNGYFFDTSIGKSAGKYQYELGYNFKDDKYEINDLGYQSNNNTQTIYSNFSYRIFEPTKKYENYGFYTWYNANYLHKPGKYTGNECGFEVWANTLKRFSFGGNINGNIGNQYDYYEPRVPGRFFVKKSKMNLNSWISSDYRKKFAVDASLYYGIYFDDDEKGFGFGFSPRYRFSKQFSLAYDFYYDKNTNDKGFVTIENDDIIFGKRDSKDIENSISGKYSFGIKSSISLSFRHYWSPVEYHSQYYVLNSKGYLDEHPYSEKNDINYNSWNLDLNYIWEFAPGSQLIAFYRNSIFSQNEKAYLNFTDNLDNLFKDPSKHTFSLKLIYYIDYNNIKNII
ncbi:DUF5916 domain-containing protein [Lutibacter sp. B1]|uniref:DUF5916 domain-containing protein n=1 Tax=Lutibacter sp. B1 TaxID=2725996 RepID=UPI001456BB90|nr:DUF5916 domain-containing protein [Lutibacter sp. B1]NLP56996.1 carbohydrate binding family 9 domain-containing protein [Lutibacter sp. B1]